MKHLFCTLTLMIISMGFPAYAQESYNLDQVLEKVSTYSPELRSKQIEKQIADYRKREALGSALPQISTRIAHTQNFNVPKFEIPGSGTFQMQGDYSMEYGASISQALYTFGTVSAALRAADKFFAMVDSDITNTKNNVVYQAKVAFYRALLAQRNLEISQSTLKNAEDNLNILMRSFSGGRAPQGDLLRLQADVENKRPLVQNAKAELRSSKIALNVLMGNDPLVDFNIVGKLRTSFPILSGPILQNILIKEAPTLQTLNRSAEYQDELANVSKSVFLPKLGLFYNFNRLDQSYNDRFDRDQTLTTSALGIALNWNIWDGGISHAAYQRAKVEASKAHLDVQKTKDTLTQQVLSTLEQFNNYKTNISSYEKAVSLAKRSFQLSQNRLRSGKTSITELNDTQSLLLQTELQQASNLFQMNSSHALLESIVGKDLK